MRRSDARPPAGSGSARLALATLALAPVLGATYAGAVVARRRFAQAAAAKRALERLGLGELVRGKTLHAAPLGSGKSNAVVAVELAGDGAPERLVLKKALPFGSLMAWGARNFGANYVYAERTSGKARIAREATALRLLAERGVAVPRCLAADVDAELIALEWIDGTHVAHALRMDGAEVRAREVGVLLRRVHELGVTLADGHPGNMMIARDTDRIVLFDLEFAECEGSTPARRGFDVAYAAALMPDEALRGAMLAAYGDRSRDELEAAATAERHIARFGKLLEMERARWATTGAR